MADGMDFSLQKAVAELLLADVDLVALVGGRIFEEVIEGSEYPYVVLGATQEVDDSVQCLDASEIFVDVDVWTNTPGFGENKRITTAVKRILHNASITMAEERCVLFEHRITRTFLDQDVIVKHGIVTFRSLTEITSYEAEQP